jgi:hypothetical protein
VAPQSDEHRLFSAGKDVHESKCAAFIDVLAVAGRRIVRHCLSAALCLAVTSAAAPAGPSRDDHGPPLVLEATIPLDGVAGRIDHMAVDLRRNRLLVAELGNDTVDVVDLATRRSVHRIKRFARASGGGVSCP